VAPPQGTGAPPAVRFELVGKVEERPLLVTHDHTGRTFVVEQPGRLWMIKNGKTIYGGYTARQAFADMPKEQAAKYGFTFKD
jgi:uncharacterized protein YegJ (DUF2314 family)